MQVFGTALCEAFPDRASFGREPAYADTRQKLTFVPELLSPLQCTITVYVQQHVLIKRAILCILHFDFAFFPIANCPSLSLPS